MNKAIQQYINKRYNIYDISQQTTDDLRVLKATAILTPTKVEMEGDYDTGLSDLYAGTYEVNLPLDYMHILNCICTYKLNSRYKCYDAGNHVQFAAKRLTADAWSTVLNDYYQRPTPQRPYYYIHHLNQSTALPTNPVSDSGPDVVLNNKFKGTDTINDYTINADSDGNPEVTGNLPRKIKLKDINNKSLVEREAGVRYGNKSNVRMEIRYGADNTVFTLDNVMVDYIKAPQHIRLTQEQVNLTTDTSQIMEFPDSVCFEIINELTTLVMENVADPRLQSHLVVTNTIASPAQQQPAAAAQPVARQAAATA